MDYRFDTYSLSDEEMERMCRENAAKRIRRYHPDDSEPYDLQYE